MLVMSRRIDQKVLFPELGITVTVAGIRGNTAKIGVDAPKDITVIRDEIADSFQRTTFQTETHATRNILNSVNLFALLYREQVSSGLTDEAASTFVKMVDFLEKQTQGGNVDFSVETSQKTIPRSKIMIVEDDVHQCELLTRLLELRGLDVTSHQNCESALQHLCDGSRPDIVLLDWTMPKYGGKWLVPRIIKKFGDNRPSLFVLSGCEHASAMEKDTVDAWLAKPLNHDALLARIQAVQSTCKA